MLSEKHSARVIQIHKIKSDKLLAIRKTGAGINSARETKFNSFKLNFFIWTNNSYYYIFSLNPWP